MIFYYNTLNIRGDFVEKKFHINNQGNIAKCNAKVRACPFGGSDRHFSTFEEAKDVRNKKYEEEFDIISFIDRNDVKTEEEAEEFVERIREEVHRRGAIDNWRENEHGLKDFTDSIDLYYVLYATNESRLQADVARKFQKIIKDTNEEYLKKRRLTTTALNNFYKIENEKNKKMKKLIDKKVVEKVDASHESSIGIGTSLLSFFNLSQKATGKIQRVEEEELELSKADKEKNKRILKETREIEALKKKAFDASVAPKLKEINRRTDKLNEIIDKEIRSRANLIRNIDNRTQALKYIDELKELKSRIYITREREMNLLHRFREAEKSRDQVQMRSCNRLVNIFSKEDEKITLLFNERINEMAFERNYERLRNGEIFDSKSSEEFNEEFVELHNDIIHCFDT